MNTSNNTTQQISQNEQDELNSVNDIENLVETDAKMVELEPTEESMRDLFGTLNSFLS